MSHCNLKIQVLLHTRDCNKYNKMASNKCDIQEDMFLSIEVEKYPCLYTKVLKGYKEIDRKRNAWHVPTHSF